MTLPAPTYDLVLLLDTQAEESTREKILADARASIQARGELVRDDDWGERPLSYPIDHRKSAEYHLLQFHVTDKELLGGLDRTLRITDGVVRFRLIKLRPGVPDPPDMRSSAVPPSGAPPSSPPPRRAEGEPSAETPTGDAAAPPPPAGEPPTAPAPASEAPAAEAPEATETPEPASAPAADTPAAEAAPPAATEQAPAEGTPAEAPPAETSAADAPPAE